MMDTLKPHVKRLYRTCTASTKQRALYAVPVLMLLAAYGTLFLGGIATGANTAVAGEGLASLLTKIDAARFELWMDFATASTVSKALFGLMYPLVGLAWTTAIVGMHAGYAIPQLGYVANALGLFWPVAIIVLVGMQLIRFYDLS